MSFHRSATWKLEYKEFAAVLIPTLPSLEWRRMKRAKTFCTKNISLLKVWNREHSAVAPQNSCVFGAGLWPAWVPARGRVPGPQRIQ